MSCKLPCEIVEKIIEFGFDRCEKCKKQTHFTELTKDCRIFEYRSVFHDDFWSYDNIFNFNIICKRCVSKYTGKVIINLCDSTYSWIQKNPKYSL